MELFNAIMGRLDVLFGAHVWRDAVNGSFEALSGLMVLNHCRVLYAEKVVRGVSVASTFFFVVWGLWNVFYYPSLAQSMSFYGGLVVVASNALYVGMMLYYRSVESARAAQDNNLQRQEPRPSGQVLTEGDPA